MIYHIQFAALPHTTIMCVCVVCFSRRMMALEAKAYLTKEHFGINHWSVGGKPAAKTEQ